MNDAGRWARSEPLVPMRTMVLNDELDQVIRR